MDVSALVCTACRLLKSMPDRKNVCAHVCRFKVIPILFSILFFYSFMLRANFTMRSESITCLHVERWACVVFCTHLLLLFHVKFRLVSGFRIHLPTNSANAKYPRHFPAARAHTHETRQMSIWSGGEWECVWLLALSPPLQTQNSLVVCKLMEQMWILPSMHTHTLFERKDKNEE